jgi:hypothetical protein
MECGIGHQPEEEIFPDGSMANFCPACPQPGINLPKDWKTKYTPYVVIYHLTISRSLIVLKKPAHPDIYHGRKLLRRAYEASVRGEGCFTVRRNGLHGQSGVLQGPSSEWTRNSPGMQAFLNQMLLANIPIGQHM